MLKKRFNEHNLTPKKKCLEKGKEENWNEVKKKNVLQTCYQWRRREISRLINENKRLKKQIPL